ncbi:MAG: hypothetical protein H7239_03475 [Flavobacterium sp.]|nr:hypothetical protein [Flavobacterium sp.]
MLSNFKIITDEISKATGIDNNLFLLNLKEEEEVYKDYCITEYNEHEISNYHFLGYQYRKNIKEKWCSISFRISKKEAKNLQKIINPILKKMKENKLDLENYAKNISYNVDNFNYFTCLLKGEYFIVDLAKKNELKKS